MDRSFYEHAIEGSIHVFHSCSNPLNQILTPNENTILHVHLTNRYHNPDTDFVNIILAMCPALLLQPNMAGETPLHTAAEYGQYEAVAILINRAKALDADDPESGVTALQKMLRTTTEAEGETALHKAARTNRSEVVRLLIKEDPNFQYSVNICGETPIYIAAVKGYSQLVKEILDNCTAVDFGGPDGRSAMHAAVISNNEGMVEILVKKEKNLIARTDDNGWSPLHYAAYYGSGNLVEVVLRSDASIAYIGDKIKNRTAFHMAAMQGNTTVMKQFEILCPDCHEQVDNRGWNALHYAVLANNSERAFMEFVESERLRGLLNKKDNKGNTPLHLFAASYDCLPRFLWEEKFKSRVDMHVLNNQNLSISDILSGKFPENQKEMLKSLEDIGSSPVPATMFVIKPWEQRRIDKEMRQFVKDNLERAGSLQIVAATLVATVTFAAAFTLPGGTKSDDPNKGTAFSIKNAAFAIFILADALALAYSTTAVLFYVATPFIDREDWKAHVNLFSGGNACIACAVVFMSIAFAAGTYVELRTSLWLTIMICLIIGWSLLNAFPILSELLSFCPGKPWRLFKFQGRRELWAMVPFVGAKNF